MVSRQRLKSRLCPGHPHRHTHTHTAIYAFMVPMEGVRDSEEEIVKDIQGSIKKQIGSFAVPQRYLVCVPVLCACVCVCVMIHLHRLTGCPWSAQDTVWEDNETYSKEDSC